MLPIGPDPSPYALPLKAYSTVSLPVVSILKTVPHPSDEQERSPPTTAVPYKLPWESWITLPPHIGPNPSLPVNLCNTFSLPAGLSSNTTPHPFEVKEQ